MTTTLPAGWKPMPAVMTLEMSVAFAEAWYSKRRAIDDDDMQDAYAAMLAAAPTPPASAQDDTLARTGNTATEQNMFAAGLEAGEANAKNNAAIRAAPTSVAPGDAQDELTLAQKYEDACIFANANAQDAARWRKIVAQWRIQRVEVFDGVTISHTRSINWDDLTRQVDAALAAQVPQQGEA